MEALVGLLVNGFVPRLTIRRVQDDDMVTMEVFDEERLLFRVTIIDESEDLRLIFEPVEEDDIVLPLVIDLKPMIHNDLSRTYVESFENWMILLIHFKGETVYWGVERRFRAATWHKLGGRL